MTVNGKVGNGAVGEFDRQVENLIALGYPKAAGLPEAAFRASLAPLRRRVTRLPGPRVPPEDGHLPFVIVIAGHGVSMKWAMGRVLRNGKRG